MTATIAETIPIELDIVAKNLEDDAVRFLAMNGMRVQLDASDNLLEAMQSRAFGELSIETERRLLQASVVAGRSLVKRESHYD